MVSPLSKGFFLFLIILPDVLLCDEIIPLPYVENAEGNRFYTGYVPRGIQLPGKEQMMLLRPLPESFDAREQWPYCKHIIGLIRDQKHCGPCWAFSAAEVISDRICIQSNGYKQVIISPVDVLTCCRFRDWKRCEGCRECWSDTAFDHWVQNGIVTGGDFDSHYGCRSYTLTNNNWKTINKPPCSKRCEQAYPFAYQADKHHGSKAYSNFAAVTQIQREIYNNGPVSAAFKVYPDFTNYKSKVYYHTDDGSYIYRHAIKIIGWGVEDGIPYWLCANSWKSTWGDNGYVKILRGDPTNNCGIETYINA